MEKEKKEKTVKPVYGMGSNVWYMLQLGCEIPGLMLQGVGYALMGVVISVTALYMSPTLLKILEERQSLEQLLWTLGCFVLILLSASGVKGYLESLGTYRIAARQKILDQVNSKAGSCSYPLLLNDDFQNKMAKARNAANGNSSATEAIWHTLFAILENGICFCIYLFLLAQVKPLLIVITLVTTGLGYGITYHFVQKDYQFQEEISKGLRGGFWVFNAACDPKLAKDVRIFGMKEWLKGMFLKYQRLVESVEKRRAVNNILADLIFLALDFLRNGISYAYLLWVTLKGNLTAGEFLLYFNAVTGYPRHPTEPLPHQDPEIRRAV